MTQNVNEFGQPVGPAMPDWTPRPLPDLHTIKGEHCTLVKYDKKYLPELFSVYSESDDAAWTFMLDGPPKTEEEYIALMENRQTANPLFTYIVLEKGTDRPIGDLTLFRADTASGSIEVGHIRFSKYLQRTIASTEIQYLLMKVVFEELGYRRYEWKCDSMNAPSRRAAVRLGFSPEGIFRQHVVYKGRSRDTAWFSVIDSEWPSRKAAFEAWLAPENLKDGKQVKSLEQLRDEHTS